MTTPTAHPLHWPQGFPRTKEREQSRFKTTLSAALNNVTSSLSKFGKDSHKAVSGIVLSSNVTLGAYSPADPGVAVWFTWEEQQLCIPCDRYKTVADNLQAIHHVIEARRTELRHGTLHLVRATFAGFKALPAPPGKHWRAVLALPSDATLSRETVEIAYKQLAVVRHPDKGGTDAAMAELVNARDAARRELCE
jgi:hypothetical protein